MNLLAFNNYKVGRLCYEIQVSFINQFEVIFFLSIFQVATSIAPCAIEHKCLHFQT